MANQFGRSRAAYRPIADVLVLAGIGAVASALLASDKLAPVFPPAPTHELLTLVAAGIGAGSAIMGVIASRVLEDRRTAWVAAALVLYSAVVLPLSAATTTPPGGVYRAPMLVIYLTALVLLAASVRPPAALGAWGCWAVAVAGAGLGLIVLGMPDASGVLGVIDDPLLTVCVLVCWTGSAVAFAVAGISERNAPALRLGLGLGLVVVAVAQLYRVTARVSSPDLPFDGLRLLGLAVVLLGLAQLVVDGLRGLQSCTWEQQEALAAAALHLERAREASAERDHELRNGLAGLAGVTQLLSAESVGDDRDRLRQAVLEELGRLLALVDGDEPAAPAEGFLVEEVLRERVALRRSAAGTGMGEVALHLAEGVRAAGERDVLAQVVANLLANCDRHAPGAPITVATRREGGEVLVEVRDAGPGLPPGVTAESLLERGTRDEAAGGAGLGLHISAGLLGRTGGLLTLRDARPAPGCVATIHLPGVTEVTAGRPLVADQQPSVVSSGSADNR